MNGNCELPSYPRPATRYKPPADSIAEIEVAGREIRLADSGERMAGSR